MLSLKDKSDLDRLITEDIQESLTLDYKAAAALGKSNNQRNELCKDVSAFANSAGGQIIYGIEERDHHPVRVQDTDGVASADISREWVEQVIDSNVQPRIMDLHIQPIDAAAGRIAYVITIPPATTNAPHQAPDHKYYYRQIGSDGRLSGPRHTAMVHPPARAIVETATRPTNIRLIGDRCGVGEKETKGALRYQEVDEKGEPIESPWGQDRHAIPAQECFRTRDGMAERATGNGRCRLGRKIPSRDR
jgi:Schlafen, AlbA_2